MRNGVVVSTIRGTAIEIFEEVFTTTFELPTEGLTDLSEVPKNLVFDARSLFSESTKQVSVSCLKKELKIAYRLLNDILVKTIYVKAGSFDAVTRDRFMLMTAITFDVKVNWSSLLFGILKEMVTPGSRQAKGYAIQICALLKNIPGLELGESKSFPVPRVLTEKMVHRYVVINEKVGIEEVAYAPRVKKTPVKKAVSQKRPAAVDVEVAPVVKKKRTTKGKPVKRKRRLVLEAEDEIVDDQTAAEAATGMQEPVIENEQAVTEPAVGKVLVEPVVEKAPVVEPAVEIPEADTAVDRMFVEPVVDSASDSVSEQAVATVVNEGPSTTDDVDDIC
ncbi:hypothetical protein F511_38551 [Dorcoceras hygrometricum]|uniref:Patatin-like protein 2 n=1 Tax=Dorcoceras hygrometricum TaxID=472368 RepID=A0A2Z7DJN2_9LAMI|nr:hypothetical protein F511_38551 [Dorcoceras hygrometricum]